MTIFERGAGTLLCVLALSTGAALPAPAPSPAPEPGWRRANPGIEVHYPRDHWAHRDFRTEWWYFTGHLAVDGEREPRFGYQFTLFRVALAREAIADGSAWSTTGIIMGHAAITDLRTGSHRFSDVLHREIPLLGGFGTYPEERIAWCRGPAGTEALWELSWNGSAFDFTMTDRERGLALRLSTEPERPRVFQGPGGYSRKGRDAGAASMYVSFTRLATRGNLRQDGVEYAVSGRSWMDQEFGSDQMGENQVGWDWFSLQLDGGRDLMLYALRDASGGVDFGRGTLVETDGSVRYLDLDDWTRRATGSWTSPRTGIRYPSRWEIRVPAADIALTVRPLLDDQENVSDRSSNLSYWEGAVEVLDAEGTGVGRGYVELTGYGKNNRPTF